MFQYATKLSDTFFTKCLIKKTQPLALCCIRCLGTLEASIFIPQVASAMVLSAFLPSQSSLVAALLNQIATELAQDQNLIRIKKLLLYACTGTWENDPQRLNRASLNALLQHLFDTSPSFEQLQQQLNQVVATLNKSAEYTLVANAVISRFPAVYAAHQQGQTQISESLYHSLTEQLQQLPQPDRVKKLLLLTCRSKWESNTNQLEQVNWMDLVRELHQMSPTLASLQMTLNQVAQALSKPSEYRAIAMLIAPLFQPLYQSQTAEWSAVPMSITSAPTAADSQLEGNWPLLHRSDLHQSAQDPLSGASEGKLDPATEGLQSLMTPGAASDEITAPAPSRERRVLRGLTAAPPQQRADLFDLRLQILQDANPFKVKILLFSLLHELFDWQADHDGLLKTHELDDLLRILFLSYPLYSDLDQKLRHVAKQLAADEYLHSADVLLQSLQSFYVELPVEATAYSVTSAAALSEMTRMKAGTQELTLPERPSHYPSDYAERH